MVIGRYHSRVGVFTFLIFWGFIYSCQISTDNSSFKSNLNSDSVRIHQDFIDYTKIVYKDNKLSRPILDKLIEELSELPVENQSLKVYYFSRLSISEAISGNLIFADSLITEASNLAYQIQDTTNLDLVHQGRAIYFWINEMLDSALFHFQISEHYAEKVKSIESQIAAKINMATIGQNQHKYEKSISELLEIIDLCKEHEKWELMGDACNNLGNVYSQTGQLYTALTYFQKSSELYELSGAKQNYGSPVNNLGLIYQDLGMDSLAMDQYKKVKKIARQANNHELYAIAEVNISSIYYKKKEYKKSLEKNDEIIDYLNQNDHPISEIHLITYTSYGQSYLELGNFMKAKAYLKKAISIADSLSLELKQIEAERSLAELYFKEHNMDSLEYYSSTAYKLATKHNRIKELIELAFLQARVNQEKNQYQKAIQFYEVYHEYCEAYLDTLSSHQAKDLAVYNELQRRDTENQVKEMEVIAQKETIHFQKMAIILAVILMVGFILIIFFVVNQSQKRSKLNIQLNEENEFKTNLISIISHDLRSPLLSLYSTLRLMEEADVEGATREKLHSDILKQTEKNIDMTDNLLFWTREQIKGSSIIVDDFNLHKLVNSIISNDIIDGKKNQINFENNIAPDFEIKSDKNILHLVLRNLISNALKFTTVDGFIRIESDKSKDEYIISVSDTGIGIDPQYHDKILNDDELVSMKGLHGEQGKGFGLILCKYFLHKIGGKIWFLSQQDVGTTFYFSIPFKMPR